MKTKKDQHDQKDQQDQKDQDKTTTRQVSHKNLVLIL